METLKSFLMIALELTVLFFVISFILSALQSYIPYKKIEHYLSKSNQLIGILAALLFAFITPFCSCSTIPVVVNMLRRNMPFKIVVIFLFASPVLDPTILTLMGVILGWKVALIYTVVTAISSVIIGLTLSKLKFERYVKNVMVTGYEEEAKQFSWRGVWDETIALMKSVYPYLIIGAAIGAVIHGLVPTVWIAQWLGKETWWIVPIASVIGIPLYIRLSSMIPISHVFIMKGMALGPVMAMMISSAGASLPEIILLKSIFKKQLVITFIVSVISMATISGFIFYLV